MVKQRLQKVLAAAGIASRRRCEEIILEGVVRVNGRVVDSLPVFVDPGKDIITINGREISAASKVYFLLNKPKGVICTNSDPRGRKKAIDIVQLRERIFCVGRLDVDSTGIIILTNDNELTNRLTHPRFGLSKTYVVNVRGEISSEQIEKLKKGVWLAEGKTAGAAIKILRRSHKQSLVEVTIREGLNREIRRMFAKIGLPVKSLERTHIGKINARGLGIGKFRPLTKEEVEYLKNLKIKPNLPNK
jgi:23S rRNA pseudouridine2605 synthase